MQNWGNDRIPVEPTHLPAADFLVDPIANTGHQARALVKTFEQHKNRLSRDLAEIEFIEERNME